MTKALKAAVGLTTAGMVFSVACLLKTTPMTMTAFFFFGLPCFAAAIAAYFYDVVGRLLAAADRP